MKKTKLSNNYTIEDYESFKNKKDKTKIALLIQERLHDRFIIPALDNDKRHGFAMMAIACLTIEAFQAFKTGHTNSESGVGRAGFKAFFHDHSEFNLKDDQERKDFYKHIRCGLLHDAETRDGWKIIRTGDIIDKSKKTINATKCLLNIIKAQFNQKGPRLMTKNVKKSILKTRMERSGEWSLSFENEMKMDIQNKLLEF